MRALRQRAGLTQIEVVERMGLRAEAYPQIGRNERGVQMPRADSLYRFLQAVDANFADFHEALEGPGSRSKVSKRVEELARELGQIARKLPS